MKTVEKKLFRILNTIGGSGSFVTSGSSKFTFPGLYLEGVGEVAFPLNASQAKALIGQAERAPFGKGSQTIRDTSVRNTWEIDAAQMSFRNPEWTKYLKTRIKGVKKGLGIEDAEVKASLYKLLVYEEGGFFLPHRDSEKEPGMFGTLVICLPSAHSGGELVVRFEDQEETFDFSDASSNYSIAHAAFYADCEHEIKPVTSGYRICLVYNLIQTAGAQKINSPKFKHQEVQIGELLNAWEETMVSPKAILLGHQYTPANFSQESLKNKDLPQAETLMNAAEKAGYYAMLGLVTAYTQGSLEVDHDYYGHYVDGSGTMGEIFDSYINIEYWAEGACPDLGELPMDEDDVITDLDFGKGEPIEEEEEGYTGNAGMTIEYWYHYAAVILWPKSQHIKMLQGRPVATKLKWLSHYLENWEDATLESPQNCKALLLQLGQHDYSETRDYKDLDFSSIALALSKLDDATFLRSKCIPVLSTAFDKISAASWLELFKVYPDSIFVPVFEKALENREIGHVKHWLGILVAGTKTKGQPSVFELQQIQQIPSILEQTHLSKEPETSYYSASDTKTWAKNSKEIIKQTIQLSNYQLADNKWLIQAHQSITKAISRSFLHKVLAPVILNAEDLSNPLTQALHSSCVDDLKKRTGIKPPPPANWSRKVPENSFNKEIWDMLTPFLKSPTEKVFDYKKPQTYRSNLAYVIKDETIDLKMETIKKGSPHTLRLTKTTAAHQRELGRWKEDVALFGEFGG